MYYNYLDRQKHYLRSFRTHNLWLNQYQTKMRTPRVQAFHITAFKRLAKSYSGVSQPPQFAQIIHKTQMDTIIRTRSLRNLF